MKIKNNDTPMEFFRKSLPEKTTEASKSAETPCYIADLLPEGIETDCCSDGYHTFAELYEFRKVYNAALFNEWARQGKYNVHKSKRHYEGDGCFGGGWFIVVALLPDGQISNHYEMKDYDLFKIPEYEKALFPFDGHTAANVLDRLKAI